MSDDMRDILNRAARGDLSPEDAARLLDELESRAPASAAEPNQTRAARVRVVRSATRAEIIGDPTVHEAFAEGPHVLRHEGDAVVIEGLDDGEELSGLRSSGRSGYSSHEQGERLRVVVNPELPLEVEGRAGSVHIRDIRGPIRSEALAGSISIEGFTGPLDVSLRAGSVRGRGRLDHGHSRVSCEAGSLQLHLERGSSVRISAHAAPGQVSVEGREAGRSWVIGRGVATLDLHARRGSIRVTAEE